MSFGFGSGQGFGFTRPRPRPLPPALERLTKASVAEQVAALTRPDVILRVGDDTPAGSHEVSLWEFTRRLLQNRAAEARPLLLGLLTSPEEDARVNALQALTGVHQGESYFETLRPFVSQFLPLLDDPKTRVRAAVAPLLRRVKDARTEEALLRTLARAKDEDETKELLEAVGGDPLFQEERVAQAVLEHLDEARWSRAVVFAAFGSSYIVIRSKTQGEKLIAAFWRILSTTKENSLLFIFPGPLSLTDPRTLPYLRQAPRIVNPKARDTAVGLLLRHEHFDPRQEARLLEILLHDPEPSVRVTTIGGLCARKQPDARAERARLAFAVVEEDKEPRVQQAALLGAFTLLRDTPELYRELAAGVLAALEKENLRPIVIYQTGALAKTAWKPQDPGVVEKVRAWWQEQKR